MGIPLYFPQVLSGVPWEFPRNSCAVRDDWWHVTRQSGPKVMYKMDLSYILAFLYKFCVAFLT